jgi:hypothetical protein
MTKQPAISQAEPQHTHERFTPVHRGSQRGLWKLTSECHFRNVHTFHLFAVTDVHHVNSNAYTCGSDPNMAAFGHLQRDPNLQTNVSNVSVRCILLQRSLMSLMS